MEAGTWICKHAANNREYKIKNQSEVYQKQKNQSELYIGRDQSDIILTL
jgi:hypothetical protein